jgi:hypothetical protein
VAKRRRQPSDDILKPEKERPEKLVKEEKKWGSRLVRAKGFQKKYAKTWEENRRLIFGETLAGSAAGPAPPWTGMGSNAVSYGWGLFKGLETNIYVQNPDVRVTAKDASAMPKASRVSQIVKYDFSDEQMNVKEEGNFAFLDAWICGYGGCIESVKTKHRFDKDGKRTGEIEWQEFDIRRIDPKDVLFSQRARRHDLSDSDYLFVAWYPTIEELENDEDVTDLPENIEKFPEATEFTRTIQPPEGSAERQAATAVGSGGTAEKDPAFKTICVWEVYDKVGHEVLLLTDYQHYIIGRREWPVNLRFGARELFPYTPLLQHPIPGRFYPKAEVDLIAPQLREMNITENLISEDSRTKFKKWLTIAGIFTDDQKAKITDTGVKNALMFVSADQLRDVLGIQGGAIDPAALDLRNLVVPIEDIAPKKDLFARFEMLEKEIQHIVGYGPAVRGGLPSTRSAREAMMINQEKERKLDKRRDHIGDFYRQLAMKHVRFLQKYMATERYVKIFPKAGQLADWAKYNRDDIQGDFEFDVLAGTSAPKTTETRKASELQLFQAITPILMQSQLPLRPAFERLAEFYDWDGVDALFANVKAKAAQALQAVMGFNKGQVPPEALLNAVSQLLMAELTPGEFEMMRKQMEGQPGAGAGQPPAPQGTQGEARPLATQGGVP